MDGYLYWVDYRKNALRRLNTLDVSETEEVFTIEDGHLVTFDTDGASGVFYLFDSNSDIHFLLLLLSPNSVTL